MNLPTKSPQQKNLTTLLVSMKDQIEAALPKHLNVDRMTRVTMTALRQNRDLMKCSPESFLGALMQACALGLEPNTPLGMAYLIPYGRECSFQVGYKGILDLAYRTGRYKNIYAMEVYDNDEFERKLGLDISLHHVPADDPEGEPVRYYAVYVLANGGANYKVWSRQKVLNHAKKFSKSFSGKKSPWQTSFDAMAKKTVLLDLLKTAPLSPEMADALGVDNAVIKGKVNKENEVILDTTFDYVEDEKEDSKKGKDGASSNEIQEMLDTRTKTVEPELVGEEKKISTRLRKKKEEPVELEDDSKDPFHELDEIEKQIEKPKINEEEHIGKNKTIYDVLDRYIIHPNIIKDEKLKAILGELRKRALFNDDKVVLVAAIRKATNKDYKPIESLVEIRHCF